MKSFKQILLESKLFEGYTEEQWRKLDSKTKSQYIKDHPNSKYAQKEVANKSNVNVKHMELSDKKKISDDENTSPEILAKLANDKNEDVLMFVANNKNTPSKVLAKLANSKNIRVRRSLADNKNIPQKIIDKLLYDNDHYVRLVAASNPSVSSESLDKLAKSLNINKEKDYFILSNISDNPSSSKNTKKYIHELQYNLLKNNF